MPISSKGWFGQTFSLVSWLGLLVYIACLFIAFWERFFFFFFFVGKGGDKIQSSLYVLMKSTI